jgi:hypothetical protein
MTKKTDVRDRIEAFRRACEGDEADAALAAARRALSDRHYLMVARAAELCGERLLYDLEPGLVAAYRRFLDNPVKRDPGCTAKGAIVRALVTLDCQDDDFFVAGMRYRQHEPVWGGSVDTGVHLRVDCAMGLVGTPRPRALIELIELLHDPEPQARSGAIRAIGGTEPAAAEAVLRCKALSGDPEPEVVGDCLVELLRVEPDESPAFVARFLDAGQEMVPELAALALGECRQDAALQILRARWEAQPFKRDSDRVLLRAAVLHRSEAAFDWLLEVVDRGDRASAELVIRELAAYRANKRLAARLAATLEGREDPSLSRCFAEAWGES